jgi:6-pyruvoyltetrahydropterin/6-carboxytetrahydropterin synthase
MFTCKKLYPDFPFAHRQHNHDGHCAFIHGHNWGFEFTFGARQLDDNQFVVDFGKLKWLRDWLNHMFDHTLVLNADDPQLEYLKKTLATVGGKLPSCGLADIRVVPNCGAEGLARFLYEEIDRMIRARTGDRVYIYSVSVLEDSKNSATFNPHLCQH